MNYLAHLHIAHLCQSSLTGNLLGDFVRGNPEGRWSTYIVKGIRMHRFVDSYTDSHPLLADAKAFFDPRTRRFAGIALDVFWDHCLANQWHQYHEQSLESFARTSGDRLLAAQQPDFPQTYLAVVSRMVQGQWLVSYREMDNIHFALQRISQRRPKFEPVAECSKVIETHYQELNQCFELFYPTLIAASKQFQSSQSI
ncbi:acyl carrier protein phosphodiesterase [Vibrio sp. LaRot3]|uniref:acyl carrier protein phosphodiesterase n=1 Tax=Vibrio sp. LaRot3 TaxID=2998829 RepID=UPI0022CDC7FA|nr:ACP phosphodiesterase [Vibrio sp. LaRot3]MDA0148416.1 ACP phosphodiesterase [Vibrio sp. LaRot3]